MTSDLTACAVVVRRGDMVSVRGEWFEVQGSRLDCFATGGAVVVLTFATRRPLRVPVFLCMPVARPNQVMNPSVVQRREDWALAADDSGTPLIFEVECTTCHAACEASNDPESAERTRWCIEHTKSTGHTGYREIRTGFLRATPLPAAGREIDGVA